MFLLTDKPLEKNDIISIPEYFYENEVIAKIIDREIEVSDFVQNVNILTLKEFEMPFESITGIEYKHYRDFVEENIDCIFTNIYTIEFVNEESELNQYKITNEISVENYLDDIISDLLSNKEKLEYDLARMIYKLLKNNYDVSSKYIENNQDKIFGAFKFSLLSFPSSIDFIDKFLCLFDEDNKKEYTSKIISKDIFEFLSSKIFFEYELRILIDVCKRVPTLDVSDLEERLYELENCEIPF